ncbi:ADP-heptose synthase [Paenibacillus macquariensis subsp. defensor]|nr:ADP-heptose synthase [Paenibacillus macquariensis subsp. defensor]
MSRQFIIEAAMVAFYGELLQPSESVEYIIPYTSILELYELQSTSDIIMSNLDQDQHVKQQMKQLTTYLEEPLNRKKIERALQIPWAKSTSIPLGDSIIVTVVNAVDTEAYGEDFDPIETELLLIAQRLQIPLLTDQFEFIQRIIEGGLPVQVFDIEDFQFAIEDNFFTPHP